MSYLFVSKEGSLKVGKKTGFHKLLRDIYGEYNEFLISKYALYNLEGLFKYVFEKLLTEREKEVLKLKYELEDSVYIDIENYIKVHKITQERIRQIASRALRKMRKPEYRDCLIGKKLILIDEDSDDWNCLTENDDFIENIIKNDVKNLIGYGDKKFIKQIMDKNDIQINSQYDSMFQKISCTNAGETIVYKYLSDDEDKIAESIYKDIFCKQDNISKNQFSVGLTMLLLIKGYWFIENIVSESEMLISDMEAGNYKTEAKELQAYVKHYFELLHDAEMQNEEKVIVLDLGVILDDENISSVEELMREDLYYTNEKYAYACNFIKSLKENANNFEQLIEEQYK